MIRLVDVCKSFGSKEALHHINLTIEDGETLAIIGGSGSGKSTLLRLLIGLIRPTAGEIWIGDQEISGISEKALDQVRMHMGMDFIKKATGRSEEDIRKLAEEHHLPV